MKNLTQNQFRFLTAIAAGATDAVEVRELLGLGHEANARRLTYQVIDGLHAKGLICTRAPRTKGGRRTVRLSKRHEVSVRQALAVRALWSEVAA